MSLLVFPRYFASTVQVDTTEDFAPIKSSFPINTEVSK